MILSCQLNGRRAGATIPILLKRGLHTTPPEAPKTPSDFGPILEIRTDRMATFLGTAKYLITTRRNQRPGATFYIAYYSLIM